MTSPVDVLLEDGPLLAVNKPAGLLTEAPEGVDSLVARVKGYLKEREQKPGNVYLGVPHRLDRAVTGVVLFAKNSKAARRLAEQFRDRQVRKWYWALLESAPDPAAGTLIDWLEKVPDQPMGRVAKSFHPEAREATLHFRTLSQAALETLVEIELGTGRFHQIRIQFSHRGWPILGDALYGAQRPIGDPSLDLIERPIALHARRIEFLHPVRYDLLRIEAPLPPHWPAVEG